MAEHNQLGKKGEEMAIAFLVKKGFKIKESNWKFRKEEIDIIAEKDNLIVIIEVKTRSHDLFETPESAVNRKKQKFLINAADEYIKSKNILLEARFDIISIIHNPKFTKIEHIEDAFYPTM